MYQLDDNSIAQSCWDSSNPGVEPETGDICDDGKYEYVYHADGEWVKEKRINNKRERRKIYSKYGEDYLRNKRRRY
jgi:hypothetical protein